MSRSQSAASSQFPLTFGPPHQETGHKHYRLGLPLVACDGLLDSTPRAMHRLPHQRRAVVDRDIQIELLVQLVLPLDLDALGRHDEHPFRQAAQYRLPEDQASGNSLAESHFVGD